MIEPSILSWTVVIFIFLASWLNMRPEDFDDEE